MCCGHEAFERPSVLLGSRRSEDFPLLCLQQRCCGDEIRSPQLAASFISGLGIVTRTCCPVVPSEFWRMTRTPGLLRHLKLTHALPAALNSASMIPEGVFDVEVCGWRKGRQCSRRP